jgi:hypothetical protein
MVQHFCSKLKSHSWTCLILTRGKGLLKFYIVVIIIIIIINWWPESMSELYRPSVRCLSVKLVPTLPDRGCHLVSVTDLYDSNFLGFLDRSRYFFFQVVPQLYSRGWVDPVPDPLLLRKSGSAGNRTRTPGSVSRNSWPLDHRGGHVEIRQEIISFIHSFLYSFHTLISLHPVPLVHCIIIHPLCSDGTVSNRRCHLWKLCHNHLQNLSWGLSPFSHTSIDSVKLGRKI